MVGLWERFQQWRQIRIARRATSALRASVRQAERIRSDVRQHLGLIEERTATFNRQHEQLLVDLEELKNITKRQASFIEELKEKNGVLNETIRTLTASHTLLTKTYQADIANQVRLQTAAQLQRKE